MGKFSSSQVFPFLKWLSGYKQSWLAGDLTAGITIGIMLIPQGMAYAMLAGLPPVYGLYAAIIPQLIYALFGTSRQLSVGPVAMDSLLVAAGVSVMADQGTEEYLSYVVLLALMVGAIQVLLGLLRMGFLTNLLSKPVITGFTAAAAVIIGFNQLPHLLGLDFIKESDIYRLVVEVANNVVEIEFHALILGLVAIGLIKFLGKKDKRIPGALIAVALGIGVVYFFKLDEAGLSTVREIPSGLPDFLLPNWDLGRVGQLVPLALTMAIIGYMESFSIAKALESNKRSYKVSANRELAALGLANFVGAFFQSFPVAGGFSRSAVNDQSGAKTPLALVVSAGLVALVLLFLTPVFYHLPNTILAAIIIVGVIGLVNVTYILTLFKTDKIEFSILGFTFLLTLFTGMVMGIAGGIAVSILVLLYRAAYPHVARLGRVHGHHEFRNVRRFRNLDVWDDLIILRVDAPLEFVNIQYFKDFVENEIQKSTGEVHAVIIDAGPISHMDATAVRGVHEMVEALKERGIRMVWCDLIGPVRDAIHVNGLMDVIGKENIFLDLSEAVNGLIGEGDNRYKEYAIQSNL
ncbi:SulP family inorganic anion transporter [Marinoscillum sp. MHG1-6]|uniref:SulP family inorganic anion transporter n=1 Tax=Marinoscillum sp. MHG1-6 TaxID=2959627 RepID=UPI002157E15E|nr:sulfate permease [Marinoscillum sp. MHG1-6]